MSAKQSTVPIHVIKEKEAAKLRNDLQYFTDTHNFKPG